MCIRDSDGTPEDARAAINAAVKAQLSWASLTSIERAGYLTRIAQGIRKREQELTDICLLYTSGMYAG